MVIVLLQSHTSGRLSVTMHDLHPSLICKVPVDLIKPTAWASFVHQQRSANKPTASLPRPKVSVTLHAGQTESSPTLTMVQYWFMLSKTGQAIKTYTQCKYIIHDDWSYLVTNTLKLHVTSLPHKLLQFLQLMPWPRHHNNPVCTELFQLYHNPDINALTPQCICRINHYRVAIEYRWFKGLTHPGTSWVKSL